jgi:general secretion pathway protein M
MKDWLESLAPRERLMVMAAAVVVALLLVYALIWSPLRGGYVELRDTVAGQRDTAVWMQESAQLLAQLKRSGTSSQGLGGQSLLSLADSTARAGGLAGALKRVEPEGGNSVRVWLEGAAFDQLIQWLGSLAERYGISADTVSMERVADAAGRVNARLTLQAPAL